MGPLESGRVEDERVVVDLGVSLTVGRSIGAVADEAAVVEGVVANHRARVVVAVDGGQVDVVEDIVLDVDVRRCRPTSAIPIVEAVVQDVVAPIALI